MIAVANSLQTVYQNYHQRRRAIAQAQAILARSETLLLGALLFFGVLYPLLFDSALLSNAPAWLWWMKGLAQIGLLAWALIHGLVGVPLAPAQLTGATVDAMEQAAPEKELVPFPATPAAVACPLLHSPALAEQDTDARARSYGPQLWRGPRRRLPFASPIRRSLPRPASTPDPSA